MLARKKHAIRSAVAERLWRTRPLLAGGYGEKETPVPIPNTAVKLLSGDGTAAEGRGRVAHCQSFFTATGLRAIARDPVAFLLHRGRRSPVAAKAVADKPST